MKWVYISIIAVLIVCFLLTLSLAIGWWKDSQNIYDVNFQNEKKIGELEKTIGENKRNIEKLIHLNEKLEKERDKYKVRLNRIRYKWGKMKKILLPPNPKNLYVGLRREPFLDMDWLIKDP